MKVNIEDIGPCCKSVTIEIPAEKIKEEIDKISLDLKNKVNIKGFRKGKVPIKVIKTLFSDSIKATVINNLVPEYYNKAITQYDLSPISEPQMELGEIKEGENFTFKFTVEVKPQFELPEYKGIEVEKEEICVTQKDIDTYLELLRYKHSYLKEKEGEIREGDYVVIDYEGKTLDGKDFTGSSAQNVFFQVGSSFLLPEFEKELIGLKKGDEKEIVVTFPEDSEFKEVAGKKAIVKVKIKEVKERIKPEISDELAKEVLGEKATLDDLIKDAKDKLEQRAEEEAEYKMKEKIMETLINNTKIDIPQSLIELQMKRMLEKRRKHFSSPLEKEEKKWDPNLRENAQKIVKRYLIIEKIAKLENLEVSDEELDKHLEEIAQKLNQNPIKFKVKMRENLEILRMDMLERKVLDFLLSNAKIIEKKPKED